MTRRVRRMAVRGIALATLLATVASCGLLGGKEPAPATNNANGQVEKAKITLGVLPILDVAWSIVRRTRRGGDFSAADSEHIHHRLMRLGHGTKRAVYILWAWTALLSGFVLAPTFGAGNTTFLNRAVPFAVAGLGLALYTLFHPGVRDKSRAAHPATQWQEKTPAN